MLVLSRKTGASLVVPGGNLTITILKVRGQRVRLAIEAPREVVVHRREVWERDTMQLLSYEASPQTSVPTRPR